MSTVFSVVPLTICPFFTLVILNVLIYRGVKEQDAHKSVKLPHSFLQLQHRLPAKLFDESPNYWFPEHWFTNYAFTDSCSTLR
jgi:hypothetical protein